MEKYISLGRQVVYDCLFENKCLDIQKIAVLYHKALQEKGISESPYLIIKGLDGNKLLLSDKLNVEPNSITTSQDTITNTKSRPPSNFLSFSEPLKEYYGLNYFF